MLKSILFLLNIFPVVLGYKIMVYSPTLGKSHVAFLGKIADVLVQAGHDVVVFQPVINEKLPNGTQYARVIRRERDYPLKITFNDIQSDVWTANDQDFLQAWKLANFIGSSRSALCKRTLQDKALIEQLKREKFDIAIGEYSCFYGLMELIGIDRYITVYNTPLLGASILGLPSASSFVPSYVSNEMPFKNYFTRAKNMFSTILSDLRLSFAFLAQIEDRFKEVVRPNFDIKDKIGQSAFFLVNVDEYTDFPRPINHKVVYIGGLGQNMQAKPLEAKYASIVENAKKGIFLVSFGSAAETHKMPELMKERFLEAFAQFPDVTFILKYEVENNITDRYPNVVTGKWLPQNDLLAHPKMLGFITHGGANSLAEATFHGVPLITIPLFADQPRNGILVEYRKMGKYMEKTAIINGKLPETIREILTNLSYKSNAVRIGNMIRKKPMSPEERLIKYVEFAAEFGNDNNLDMEGRQMSTVEYYNIDIIVPLFLCFELILYIVYLLVKKIALFIFSKIIVFEKIKNE